MPTLDDLNETFDELGVSGDTPIRYTLDGEFYELGAVRTEHDGTVTLILEED